MSGLMTQAIWSRLGTRAFCKSLVGRSAQLARRFFNNQGSIVVVTWNRSFLSEIHKRSGSHVPIARMHV